MRILHRLKKDHHDDTRCGKRHDYVDTDVFVIYAIPPTAPPEQYFEGYSFCEACWDPLVLLAASMI